MKFFKKKTEKPVQDDVIDAAYIDRLLSGDRKIPVATKREKPSTKPLPFMPFVAAFCFLLALISLLFSLYFKKVIDGIQTDPTVPTTTVPATLSTSPAVTLPAVRPTEPTETVPTEPALRFDTIQQGEVTWLVPNKTLDLSLLEYYCTCPTLPIPEEDAPSEDWLLFFYSLLADEDSWYHRALSSSYATPQEVNLEYLLRRGIAQGGSPLESYPEAQWLLENSFVSGRNVIRLPWSDIMSLGSIYFGTTFEENTWLWYPYNRENACFYYYESDQNINFLGIIDYRWLENGDVAVRYAVNDFSGARPKEIVLHPVGDYFQIVSNLFISLKPVTIDLEDIPDMSGHVYEPGAMFVGEGYYGSAKWDSGDFSIYLPLLEPFCEGANQINEEIRSIYQPIIEEIRQHILYQTGSHYWKVSYTTYVGDDVLAIVITEYSMSDSEYYRVFNLDLATGQLLSQEDMVRRYTGMSYPEFLLRANYTIVNYLRKEYPMESEDVTNWLAKLETDVMVMDAHQLFLDHEGTLFLANHQVRSSWTNAQIPLQIAFDPNACGEEFTDWELESYRWLFDIPADGAYSYHKGDVLIKAFFFDPERFLRYLSGSEYWLTNTAWLLASELRPENAPLIRDLCKQYLSRSDTAKAAQAILDHMEKYADYY